MTRVLVTGATGFVGRALCQTLAKSGYLVRAALRSESPALSGGMEKVVIGDIGPTSDWRPALHGVDIVVHLAARVHVLHDTPGHRNLYFETNEHGTRELANASERAGVRRLVYLSSVKVNGEQTRSQPYRANDEPQPQNAYGMSKWLGEKHVWDATARSEMEAVVVRSPLVYGPGVGANFLRLLRWVDKQRPLPFGAVENRRSIVSIWNLCSLLAHVLESPSATGRTWMVSDGEDLSTPALIRRIGLVMGRRVRLLPVPVSLLLLGGIFTGRRAEVARMCSSLVLDMTPTLGDLGWSPSVTLDESLARTVEWYLTQSHPRAA